MERMERMERRGGTAVGVGERRCGRDALRGLESARGLRAPALAAKASARQRKEGATCKHLQALAAQSRVTCANPPGRPSSAVVG